MRKIFYTAPILLLAAILCGSAQASTVTFDVVGKTLNSDTTTIVANKPQVEGDQAGCWVSSTLLDPQKFTLRYAGLKPDDYDIYVNGDFIGKKSARAMADGIELTIPGTIVHPDIMRCIKALKDKTKAEYKRIEKNSEAEHKRAGWTLSQASDWVRAGIQREEAYRSAVVLIAPAGMILSRMTWPTRTDAEETVKGCTNTCWLLQQARARMYSVIKDPTLRNDVVTALTPVDLAVTYRTDGGKPRAFVQVINNCNFPISGEVKYSLPKGWKTNAKALKFNAVPSGKTFKVLLNLVGPSKTAVPPPSIPVSANVKLVQQNFTAAVDLKTETIAYP
ncbi:MAG: hypothetical protein ABFD54_15240 [Armatimonadota bacterium]